MNVLILAGGNELRWNNYMGVLKHMVIPINENDCLIERTIKLFLENRPIEEYGDKIYLVIKKINEPLYAELVKNYPIKLYHAKDILTKFDTAKFRSSRELWGEKTMILFGDVYFSKDAMSRITKNYISHYPFVIYARDCASKYTGCKYGEIFAMHFYKEFHNKIDQALDDVEILCDTGNMKHSGGWALFRKLGNLPLRKHSSLLKYLATNMFYLIDDYTEDFDYPSDYDEWTIRYSNLCSSRSGGIN